MHRRPFLVAAAFAVPPALRADERWPQTPQDAVRDTLQRLRPSQRSIVRGTSRENLFMLQGEWGEDIVQRLGLDRGNATLARALCGRPCTPDEASLAVMQAVWDALQK